MKDPTNPFLDVPDIPLSVVPFKLLSKLLFKPPFKLPFNKSVLTRTPIGGSLPYPHRYVRLRMDVIKR
jgi:hypothetical protein